MGKILCFGELLLRLSPQLGGQWIREQQLPVFVGGAELNAATALARWEVPAAYCTALPDNYLSAEILSSLNGRGVDTSAVRLSGNRIGAYYLPQGADLKNAGVIYDRAHSAFWELKPGDVNWNSVLQEVSWFHFSAISPALNESLAAVCLEAVQAASQRNITVSVDLNYRAKLWQYGKEPQALMPGLVQHCDVVMGNVWAEEKMLGLPLSLNLPAEKEAYLQQSEETSGALMQAFPRCRQVANTFRFDEAGGVRYYATLFDGRESVVAPEQRTASVVDKVGSGDTFMAGLIYGNVQGLVPQQIINFAAAAAVNKLFIKGDATTSSVDEINQSFLHHAEKTTGA